MDVPAGGGRLRCFSRDVTTLRQHGGDVGNEVPSVMAPTRQIIRPIRLLNSYVGEVDIRKFLMCKSTRIL